MNITVQQLEEWNRTQGKLKILRAIEAGMRQAICKELLKDKPEGTHNTFIGNYKVKAVRKLNYSLDQKAVRSSYDRGEFTPEEEASLRLRFELSAPTYRMITDEAPTLTPMITVKDAMPTLELIDQ